MILVDTSVWISFFSKKPGEQATRLRDYIIADQAVAVTPLIVGEVLQGARSEQEFSKLRDELSTAHVLRPRHGDETFIEAARIYARCRWQGITPRSTIDCLIARIAVEHDIPLLHDDRDFEQMRKIVPSLRFA